MRTATASGAEPVLFSHAQLRHFVCVAEVGQISAAARILYIAQPALSRSISRLESALGLLLLERHSRGVALTPEGEAFLGEAKRAIVAADNAAAAARSLLIARGAAGRPARAVRGRPARGPASPVAPA